MDALTSQIQSATVEMTVLRCTCGDPASHPAQPCPQARAEPRGIVSFWHRNPLRRLAWRLRHPKE